MLQRTPAPDPRRAAERQRAYRRRVRHGERVIPVKIGDRVLEALMRRGLPEADNEQLETVARELSVVLDQWADAWLK